MPQELEWHGAVECARDLGCTVRHLIKRKARQVVRPQNTGMEVMGTLIVRYNRREGGRCAWTRHDAEK